MSATKAIKVNVYSIRGSSRVDLGEEGSLLFANHLEIDGETVYTEGDVHLAFSSEGFLQLEFHEPTAEQREAWKLAHADHPEYWHELVSPHVMHDDTAVLYRDTLSLGEVADGITDEMFAIMVRSIEFEERDDYAAGGYRNTSIRKALRDQDVDESADQD